MQNVKELLRKGAYGVQTLYMTETMKINQKPRATANRAPFCSRLLIDGSY
jgi:hypothetical protein